MTPDQIDLSRQIVTLPGFRWQQGMRNVNPDGSSGWWTHTGGSERGNLSPWYGHRANHNPSEAVPDLADDATGGALVHWIAEMGLSLAVGADTMRWWVSITLHPKRRRFTGATLAEACARALVAIGRCA